MSDFFSPSVTYALFVLGGLAILAEASLTTFGVASVIALVFGAGVVFGVNTDGLIWWPLVIAGLSVVLSALPLALHRRIRGIELGATFVMGLGSLLFAVVNKDLITAVMAVVVTVAFYFVTTKLFEMVDSVNNARSPVGMDSMINEQATVRKWSGTSGTVILRGSYWTCDGPPGLSAGQSVRIVSHDGMRLRVIYDG